MSNTFKFTFDDMPLVVVDGIEAALVSGEAEIEYDRAGNWDIVAGGITLEGFGERDANGKRQWPQVPAPEYFAGIIIDRLDGSWGSRIYDAVCEQLERDREDAADNYADMKRDERMGL